MKIITKCIIYAVSNVHNVIIFCYFDGPSGKHLITLAIKSQIAVPCSFSENVGFCLGF